MRTRYIVGVDEAGRGPIAGPVAVGAVVVPADFNAVFYAGIRDSKQLPAHKRDEWFARLRAARDAGLLNYAVSFATPQYIDAQGIVPAIRRATQRALRRLHLAPAECTVLLDGALIAPPQFINQRTIIRGDAIEPVISLASIAAKVTRDRKMIAASKRFARYGFERHKGYGTREHYAAIERNGSCPLHRKTFLKQPA